MSSASTTPPSKGSILVVDDDTAFASALSNVFQRRGYAARVASDFSAAVAAAAAAAPDYAVIDLRLPGGSGLKLVKKLREIAPNVRIVVLTGFGSIASTVDAIKLGAVQYLTKPAHADEVLAALQAGDTPDVEEHDPSEDHVPSVYRVEWEHIHRVLAEQNGNISESARLLGIHRRTLQRKLSKHPVRR